MTSTLTPAQVKARIRENELLLERIDRHIARLEAQLEEFRRERAGVLAEIGNDEEWLKGRQ